MTTADHPLLNARAARTTDAAGPDGDPAGVSQEPGFNGSTVQPAGKPALHRFLAASAADAVAQIRAELGPEAVVVHVRQLNGPGWTRLWQRPRIEVLAYRPELAGVPSALAGSAADVSSEPAVPGDSPSPSALSGARLAPDTRHPGLRGRGSGWRVGALLESSGLLPLHAQRIVEQLRAQHGERPPDSLAEELTLARRALAGFWRQPALVSEEMNRLHVLVGPPGVGKTTCLCKWLTHAVLTEGRRARVWRLDATGANTAEALSVYGEILNVPVERTWQADDTGRGLELGFIDLPGVDWRDASALRALAEQLKQLKVPRVHLVLNAAYETPVLLAQARAFCALPVKDLLITHLDEEPRWGKLWNIVLGTNRPIRFLSAGQNIPGEFGAASPEKLFARQFASQTP